VQKIIVACLLVLGLAVFGHAYTRTVEEPIRKVTDPESSDISVSVSNSTWTLVVPLAADELKGRDGVIINNPSVNNANVIGIITPHDQAPTVSTNTAIIEIAPGDPDREIKLSDEQNLFMNSRHSAAETIYIQEFKQR